MTAAGQGGAVGQRNKGSLRENEGGGRGMPEGNLEWRLDVIQPHLEGSCFNLSKFGFSHL